MQRIIVEEQLNPKQKARRAQEYQTWLQEHGFATTLLEAHSDAQIVDQMLAQIKDIQAATEKLTALAHTLNTPR